MFHRSVLSASPLNTEDVTAEIPAHMDFEYDKDAAPRPFIGPFGGQQDWVTRGELLGQVKDLWNQPDLLVDFANRFHDHIRSKKCFSLLDPDRQTDIMVKNEMMSGFTKKAAPTVLNTMEQTEGESPPDWSRALRAFQNGRLRAVENDDTHCQFRGLLGPYEVGIFENEVRAFRQLTNKSLPSSEDWKVERKSRKATKAEIDATLLQVIEEMRKLQRSARLLRELSDQAAECMEIFEKEWGQGILIKIEEQSQDVIMIERSEAVILLGESVDDTDAMSNNLNPHGEAIEDSMAGLEAVNDLNESEEAIDDIMNDTEDIGMSMNDNDSARGDTMEESEQIRVLRSEVLDTATSHFRRSDGMLKSEDGSSNGDNMEESANLLMSTGDASTSGDIHFQECQDVILFSSDEEPPEDGDHSGENRIEPVEQNNTLVTNSGATETPLEPSNDSMTFIVGTSTNDVQYPKPVGNAVDQVGNVICCEFMARYRQGERSHTMTMCRKGRPYTRTHRDKDERLHAFKFVERLRLQGIAVEDMEEVYCLRFGKHRTARSLKRYQTGKRSTLRLNGLLDNILANIWPKDHPSFCPGPAWQRQLEATALLPARQPTYPIGVSTRSTARGYQPSKSGLPPIPTSHHQD